MVVWRQAPTWIVACETSFMNISWLESVLTWWHMRRFTSYVHGWQGTSVNHMDVTYLPATTLNHGIAIKTVIRVTRYAILAFYLHHVLYFSVHKTERNLFIANIHLLWSHLERKNKLQKKSIQKIKNIKMLDEINK